MRVHIKYQCDICETVSENESEIIQCENLGYPSQHFEVGKVYKTNSGNTVNILDTKIKLETDETTKKHVRWYVIHFELTPRNCITKQAKGFIDLVSDEYLCKIVAIPLELVT